MTKTGPLDCGPSLRYGMGVSILDVAARAGVSKSTVSRVLNGGSVSEKSRAKVHKALKELSFSPNAFATALRGKQFRTIGVVIDDFRMLRQRMHIFHRIAGMFSYLTGEGYSLLMINAVLPDGSVSLSEAINQLDIKAVSGLIFPGNLSSIGKSDVILSRREIVYTGESLSDERGFRVYMGNYDYSMKLYRYLFENGHRSVLTVFSLVGSDTKERRMRAYAECADEYGAAVSEKAFFYTDDFSGSILSDIYDAFMSDDFTAIFVDDLTLGHLLMEYFNGKGLKNPDDYSLVAIEREDDIPEQAITTVALHDYSYGEECARLMIRVLSDESLTKEDVFIPFELNIRTSVRDIRA